MSEEPRRLLGPAQNESPFRSLLARLIGRKVALHEKL
jgi:hypothetical protein